MPRPERRPLARTLLAVLLATALTWVVSGCSGGADRKPKSQPTEVGTPLPEFDTLSLIVARGAFCERVPKDAVERALGGPATKESSYSNGESARLTREVRDVAHENSCTFAMKGEVVARGWVFAPPATPRQARDLTKQAQGRRGCRPSVGAAAFGRPSVALLCREGGGLSASFRGLFGDAWLSCSLTVPAPVDDTQALLDRTGRWCVEVAKAASA